MTHRGSPRLVAAICLAAALLLPRRARSQEFAYCDLAVAQQSGKLQLNGNATIVSTGVRKTQGIRVTAEANNQRGTAFHKVPITFAAGTSFYEHFRVRISGSGGNAPPNGADGFAFMVQNSPAGLTAIGAAGTGFGYLGITNSLALELDTFQNGAPQSDPNGNHMALLIGGSNNHRVGGLAGGTVFAARPEGSTVAPFEPINVLTALESTGASFDTRDVWIDYVCASSNNCTLKVFMTFNNTNSAAAFADPTIPATLPSKPASPILQSTGLSDIATYLGGSTGYGGFSASTGGSVDEHLVTFWVLSRQPLPDGNTNSLEDLCDCASNTSVCSGNIPICDTSTASGFCRDCSSDAECLAKDATKPHCDLVASGGTGACVECLIDAHCSAGAPRCDPSTHACTANCTNDAHCAANQWCDNPTGTALAGTCMSDLANGTAMPTSANHTPVLNGVCATFNSTAAQTVCASGVCDPADNACGLALDHGTCAVTAQCRTGACVASGPNAGLCKPCIDDTQCALPNPACGAANQCVQCTAGNGSACSGTTPVCDTGLATCVACNGNSGSGASHPCSVGVPYCNLVTGACTANCVNDAQCGAGNWCDDVTQAGVCMPKVANGQAVPGGVCAVVGVRACASAACDAADAKCGIDLHHGTCAALAQCRAGLCIATGPQIGKCEPCTLDGDCSGATPACNIDTNQCVECTITNVSHCSGATALCDLSSSLCVGCQRDFGVPGAAACAMANAPYCTMVGACGTCTTNADCSGPLHSGPACIAGTCSAQCVVDSDCAATQWCRLGLCVPKAPNGDPVPSPGGTTGDAGVDASGAPLDATADGAPSGVCTPEIAVRVCLSGVCSVTDGKCGLPNDAPAGGADAGASQCRAGVVGDDGKCGYPGGTGTCTPSTAGTVCRTGTCSPSSVCGCDADSQCGNMTSNRICDDATHACIDGCRAAPGNGCPVGQVCSSNTAAAGTCGVSPEPAPEAGPVSDDAAAPRLPIGGSVEGGGCACRVGGAPRGTSAPAGLVIGLALLGLTVIRRRRVTPLGRNADEARASSREGSPR